jgi:hypothetical protein
LRDYVLFREHGFEHLASAIVMREHFACHTSEEPVVQPRLDEIVASDLSWMRDTVRSGADDHDLRRASPVLRRLLLDRGGDLPKARKLLGGRSEVEIVANDLDARILGYPIQQVVLLTAGPHAYNGRNMDSWQILRGASKPANLPGSVLTSMPLGKYLAGSGVILDGRAVSRRNILKYVCNKLGGAHYDASRGRKADKEFVFLDTAASLIADIDGFNPPSFELMAMCQALVRSPDVMTPFGLEPLPRVF